jgi:hypothetical protein
MIWHTWRWWRFAWLSDGAPALEVWDASGVWRRAFGRLFVLVERNDVKSVNGGKGSGV